MAEFEPVRFALEQRDPLVLTADRGHMVLVNAEGEPVGTPSPMWRLMLTRRTKKGGDWRVVLTTSPGGIAPQETSTDVLATDALGIRISGRLQADGLETPAMAEFVSYTLAQMAKLVVGLWET